MTATERASVQEHDRKCVLIKNSSKNKIHRLKYKEEGIQYYFTDKFVSIIWISGLYAIFFTFLLIH